MPDREPDTDTGAKFIAQYDGHTQCDHCDKETSTEPPTCDHCGEPYTQPSV